MTRAVGQNPKRGRFFVLNIYGTSDSPGMAGVNLLSWISHILNSDLELTR